MEMQRETALCRAAREDPPEILILVLCFFSFFFFSSIDLNGLTFHF